RVEYAEQFADAVPVPERRRGEQAPDRGVRILPAVLADAGDVAGHVAGVDGRVVERRREQGDQAVGRADELVVDGPHRLPGPIGGSPYGPTVRRASTARAQCSYRLAVWSATAGTR